MSIDGFPRQWDALTTEQKNLLCAHALGWRWRTDAVLMQGGAWFPIGSYPSAEAVVLEWAGDFTRDLNAAARLRAVCERRAFLSALIAILLPGREYPQTYTDLQTLIDTSADQRCHAALVALGYVDAPGKE